MADRFETKLERIAGELRDGRQPRPMTVRKFLGLIGASRRGPGKVQILREGLSRHGLVTVPDFESAFIDAPITFMTASAVPADAADSAAGPRHDPAYRVSRLEAANAGVVSVRPTDSLSTAITKMRLHDYSQLPVTSDNRQVKGAVTWKSVATRLAEGHPAEMVIKFVEPCRSVAMNESLFAVIAEVAKWDFVLVTGPDASITGIVTASDLSLQFQQLTEPFLLLDEIENHVRQLMAGHFTAEELRAARDPDAAVRPIQTVADLTLGETIRFIASGERWSRLGISDDRATVIDVLEQVREIRNDVMHFDPDGIGDDQRKKLRNAARYLDELRSIHSQMPSSAEVAPPSLRRSAGATPRRRPSGPVRRELIYAPTIRRSTFVHLSAKGESYALRSFVSGQPHRCWKEKGCDTLDSLLEQHSIEHSVDVRDDARPITKADEYWAGRVAQLNREHGIG